MTVKILRTHQTVELQPKRQENYWQDDPHTGMGGKKKNKLKSSCGVMII